MNKLNLSTAAGLAFTACSQMVVTPAYSDRSGGRGKVTFSLIAGTAHLSVGTSTLQQQSIVVSPNVIGYSELEMHGYSSTGETRVLTSNVVPVVNNCG